MTMHTLGPWEVFYNPMNGKERVIASPSGIICKVNDVLEHQKYNADLIAASPLMLDTLKKVHTQLVDWGKRNGMDFNLISEVETAITAADPTKKDF